MLNLSYRKNETFSFYASLISEKLSTVYPDRSYSTNWEKKVFNGVSYKYWFLCTRMINRRWKLTTNLTQFFSCYSGMKQEHFITANWIIDKILDFSFVNKNYQLLGRNDLFPFQILLFYSSYLSAIQDKTKGIFSLTDVLIHQTTVDSLLTDTSVKRTPRVGPCLCLFPLFDSL